jgi:hypothetical protein
MTYASHATLKALLIDPVAAEARIVSLSLRTGELVLAELYRLISCDLIERTPLDDHHLIWTDEEGWDCATGLTVIDDGANVIAGRLLVIGTTPDDEPCDVASDLAPILDRLTCHRCVSSPSSKHSAATRPMATSSSNASRPPDRGSTRSGQG